MPKPLASLDLSSPIIRIFTTDSALVATGSHGAKVMFVTAYLVGFQIVGSVVFQATGKAVPAFITALSRNVLFFLPAILILPRFFGLNGVWASFPVADVLSFLLTLILVLPLVRRFRRAADGTAVTGALLSGNGDHAGPTKSP